MRYSHVLGSAVVLAAATAAQAGMTVSLVPVSNFGSGVTAGARTFDLKVAATAGTKWASGDLQFTLASTGAFTGTSFYNSAGGGNLQALGGTGTVLFDTYVTSPLLSSGTATQAASVLGKAQYPVESGVGTAVFSSTVADIAWGDTSANLAPDGTYTVGRFSVLGNGGGDLKGRVGAANNSIAPVNFSVYLPIKGDVNGDRIVDLGDFNVWLSNGGTGTLGGTPLLAQGDVNQDGIVDLGDFNDWLSNGGNQLPGPGAALGSIVPEPASLSLVAIAGLSLAARRRRA